VGGFEAFSRLPTTTELVCVLHVIRRVRGDDLVMSHHLDVVMALRDDSNMTANLLIMFMSCG
jgi:hypothetical protein